MLDVFMTNLGKYNEGELVGEWLSLPVYDESEIDESLARIGIDKKEYEEYFITDYEWNPYKFFSINEYEDVYDLNKRLQELQELGDNELEALNILVNGEGMDISYAIDKTEEVQIYNEDDLYSIGEEMLSYDVKIPSYLNNYVDYEKYAEDSGVKEFEGVFYLLSF